MGQFTDFDKQMMQRAIALAQRGWGLTNPNPLVGAVLVKDNQIVSEGWHTRYGAPHAEVEALKTVDDATGMTLYVTLEPCNHMGKTPPCTELIRSKKVSRVIYAVDDPNPPAGGGGQRLKMAGVSVASGLMAKEATEINEIFFHSITNKTPFVLAKYAMTLDGKIATSTGDSRWISGEESRREVHRLRQRYQAILVGSGTVLADDPELSVRDWEGEKRHPLRIVLDRTGKTPLSAKVLKNIEEQPTWIVVSDQEPSDKFKAYEALGAKVVAVPETLRGLDLGALVKTLGNQGVDSLLVEGGGRVLGSFIDEEQVHKVVAFIAPKLVGGNGPGPVGGNGVAAMAQAVELENVTLQVMGKDYMVKGHPMYR